MQNACILQKGVVYFVTPLQLLEKKFLAVIEIFESYSSSAYNKRCIYIKTS